MDEDEIKETALAVKTLFPGQAGDDAIQMTVLQLKEFGEAYHRHVKDNDTGEYDPFDEESGWSCPDC